jgi:acyl-CoA synthetase (AMP-forming)/AMP-acid ligase II
VEHGIKLDTLKRILIAGASVPPKLIEMLHQALPPDGDVQTPYGATECLPVANITGRDILATVGGGAVRTQGTCVGRPVPEMNARIIRISDEAIGAWSDSLVLPDGEVGELCVKGAVTTRSYDGDAGATAMSKIPDGDKVWHRMGDLARVDAQGRLWFCGRKSERVQAASGTLFTDCVEGAYLAHPRVGRVALVGVGEAGKEVPVIVVEGREDRALADELRKLGSVEHILFREQFPVDVRHNAKIHRHTLKKWAQERVA